MGMVVIAGVKGAPGVSVTALALAHAWPRVTASGVVRPAVVVEADPAGGDLAAAWTLPDKGGLAAVAALTRHHRLDAPLLWRHAVVLPTTVTALWAPTTAAAASAALAALRPHWPGLARAISTGAGAAAGAGATLLVDVGRLDPAAAEAILPCADAVVLVGRPDLADVARLSVLTGGLRAAGVDVHLVLVGRGRYSAGEVAAHLAVPVTGLPHDAYAAAMLTGAETVRASLSRLRLLRAARLLAGQLAGTIRDTLGVTRPNPPVPQAVARRAEGQRSAGTPGAGTSAVPASWGPGHRLTGPADTRHRASDPPTGGGDRSVRVPVINPPRTSPPHATPIVTFYGGRP